jgi:hypothetical protein
MPFDDKAGAGMQVASPGVITEPLPFVQHLIEIRRSERANIGPARHKSGKIGSHRDDGRLLQHDLAEPDAVRIGGLAR